MDGVQVSLLGGFEMRVGDEPMPAIGWTHERGRDLAKPSALPPGHGGRGCAAPRLVILAPDARVKTDVEHPSADAAQGSWASSSPPAKARE